MSMYRSGDLMRNKARVRVEVLKDSGEELHGYVFLGGQERVLDLLNGASTYLPFQLVSGALLILNKAVIVTVAPDDKDRMSGSTPPAHQVYLGAPRPTAR